MRKSMSLLLCFSLLSCISLKLYSQSAENELDQVKLTQQMIGTWEVEIGEDSIMLWTVTPSYGKGLISKVEWKADGKVYNEGIAVVGFSNDFKTIFMTHIWVEGNTTIDIGRFVTEKKCIWEKFRADSPNHAVALVDYDFSKPNSCLLTLYQRGQNITWEPRWEVNLPYTKID